jgi:hypothetical protein
MTWSRRFRISEHFRGSLWIVPLMGAVLGVTEIRQYGVTGIQVMRALHAMLEELRGEVRPEHGAAVEEELARLDSTLWDEEGAMTTAGGDGRAHRAAPGQRRHRLAGKG